MKLIQQAFTFHKMNRWNISSRLFAIFSILAGYCVLVIIHQLWHDWHQPTTVMLRLIHSRNNDKKDVYASTASISHMTQSLSYQSRLDLLQTMCKEYKTNQTPRDVIQHPSELLVVDEKHKLIYCNVPKVSCTSWKKLFLIVADVDITKVVTDEEINRLGRECLNYVHKYNMTRRRYVLENYKKFMFVRDPFTRLLSAYQDKLSPRSRYGTTEKSNYYTKIALRIIRQLHGHDAERQVRSNMSQYNLTFADFIHYLVDQRTKVYDKHWDRFHELCLPCDIDYDFVGKFETLEEDVEHILNLTGINIPFPRSREKVTNSSLKNTVEDYYQTVSSTDLKKLYHDGFSFDFKLFGYSPTPFTRNFFPESSQFI